MSREPVDLPESTVTRIAALMRKAKSTDSPHEAAALQRKVSDMIDKRGLVTWSEGSASTAVSIATPSAPVVKASTTPTARELEG
jgi:hypothetical protein